METTEIQERNKQIALMLHPDDAVQIFGFGVEDRVGENVNFEIVNYDFMGKYAKIIKPKEGSFDEDGFDVTRGYKEPNKVTMFEVIDHSENGVGRAYNKYDIKSLELSYQDDGRTLKIFIK